jgi:tripartite-type tricarboxylate transporter receptor subunit TctC
MSTMKKAGVAALLAITLWCDGMVIPKSAVAEASYPSRPIRIVTPLAAGAASDIALRVLAEKLSSRFGVPVIVQNEPGGAGVIADRAVTNARADGYTILWAGNNTATDVSLFREPVDPRKELTPIIGVSVDSGGKRKARNANDRDFKRWHDQLPRRAAIQIDTEARFYGCALSRSLRTHSCVAAQ